MHLEELMCLRRTPQRIAHCVCIRRRVIGRNEGLDIKDRRAIHEVHAAEFQYMSRYALELAQ